MDEKIKNFIKENEALIQGKRWEEIYQKDFPTGFTETLLECGINPLNQGLNYIPNDFLYRSNIKKFIIPDNVTRICYTAFSRCDSLTSIEIPDSVTIISDWAFNYCTSLTSIEIPSSVTSIGKNVFHEGKSLNSITYLGTKKEALTKLKVRNKKWREGSAIKKIICTDGIIEL